MDVWTTERLTLAIFSQSISNNKASRASSNNYIVILGLDVALSSQDARMGD
jgi:hypothetical protein